MKIAAMRQRITKLEPVGSLAILLMLAHAAIIAGAWWWLRKSNRSTRGSQPAELRWFAPSDMATPKAPPAPANIVPATHALPETPAIPASKPREKASVPSESLVPPLSPRVQLGDSSGSNTGAPPESGPSPPMRPYVPPRRQPRIEIILSRSREAGAGKPPVDSPPSGPRSSNSSPAPPKTAASSGMDGVDQAIIDAFRQNWTLPSDLQLNGGEITMQMDVTIARDGRVLDYRLVRHSKNTKLDMLALQAASLIKKIAVSLPPDFSGDSYEVQMHFHLE